MFSSSLLLGTLWALTGSVQGEQLTLSTTLPYKPAPAANPMKGFVPYTGELDFPHSMEYQYVGFAELNPQLNQYTCKTVLEPKFEEIANRGNQAIFRVFLDYPDESTSVPQYLIDAGLAMTPYTDHGGGLSPDYDNPQLVAAMEGLIAALGNDYDGDPRIAYLQVGFLGHWGEWHTWPTDALMASRATQARVLTAFGKAFDKTPLLVSQDSFSYEPTHPFATYGIGFHDDAFTEGTIDNEDWMFLPRLNSFGYQDHWKTFPIGGEVLPDLQATLWNTPSGSPQDYTSCVEQTHATWLLNEEVFQTNWNPAQMAKALEGSRLLGYEFCVNSVTSTITENAWSVSLQIQNHGVAPFYGNWPLVVSLKNAAGELIHEGTLSFPLSNILPGEPVTISETQTGAYQLGELKQATLWLSVTPPDERLKPLMFANAGQVGRWLPLGNLISQQTNINP